MIVVMADDVERASGPAGGDRPARGYSWPPFAEGNQVSLRHGARSDRYVEPLARAFADALIADRPDLAGFPEAVAAWATAEARVERMRLWTAQHGLLDAAGRVRNAHDLLGFENAAMKLRQVLGLDPISDAALAKTRAEAVLGAADVDGLRARGREIWERRQAAVTAADGVVVERVDAAPAVAGD